MVDLGNGREFRWSVGGRHHNFPIQSGTSDGWSGVPLSDIIAISGGEMHSVLLKSDGTVWAMGYNGYGRLGDGTTTSRSNPVQVIDSGGSVFTGVHSISAGFSHTLYLKSDGIAWSVGYNGSGQLGDGTTISRSNPVQVMDSNGSPFSNVRKLGNPLTGWF